VYTSAVENCIYANDASYSKTNTVYTYEPTYGNLTTQTEQSWNGSAWVNYRTTSIDYFPNNGSVYLVGLPARQQIKNASNAVIAESINIYDSNSTYNQMPTVGKLSAVRTWMSGTQYSQATFAYDTWGNQTTVTTYSGYGTASTAPTTGARTTNTAFDTVFHVYPISQTTPPTANVPTGLVTTWNYDYDGNSSNDFILGVSTHETDPNGNQTSAQYDIFGRMTKLIRPGDSTASPTLTMAYQDAFPFTTTITQKIDSTRSYTVQRVYDGMGRQTKITSGGSMVDTIYQSPTVTSQSMPYVTGETIYYTTTTVNPSARTVTVTAPDGPPTSTNGLAATLTDARNNSTTTTKDVWGRVVSVAPPMGPGVTYTYDELNHLKTATRGGVTMAMKYDNAGRKIGMDDPDMGTLGTTTDDNWAWTYQYDALEI
jgi:YD repeat-containing protein